MMKTIAGIIVVIGVIVYFSFGTLSPCGMLRETVRKQDGMAAILPDSLVDAFLAGQYGALNPGRCVGILLNGNRAQVAAAPATPQPIVQPQKVQQQAPTNVDPMKIAMKQTETAIMECRAKRLNGELKTYLASAQCANPTIMRSFGAANYRYMDLIAMFTAKRAVIAEKIDRGELTEVQGQAENTKIYSEVVEAEKRRDSGR
jgi:hypothetical protein